ncbi:MAG: hypothetical protein IKD41_03250, partial [Alistipes sp.]|nr:hypothetical protein [Alistipes sp.]
MKRLNFIVLCLFSGIMIYSAQAENRAEWRLSKNREKKSVSAYLETGFYNAAVGIKSATLSFNHKGK